MTEQGFPAPQAQPPEQPTTSGVWSGAPSFRTTQPAQSASAGIAGVALLVSAVLAIGGSFGMLARVSMRNDDSPMSGYRYSAWAMTRENPPGSTESTEMHGPLLGIPLTMSAILALVAGILLLVTLRRGTLGPRLLAMVSGGALAATAITICLFAEGEASLKSTGRPLTVTTEYGLGMWLILAAGVIALVGIAAALLGPRNAGQGLQGQQP